MRINKYIAQSSGLSRRAADQAINDGRVLVNNLPTQPGQQIGQNDIVTIDDQPITPVVKTITILLNKPIGYVVSRDGQGSATIYDLLPPKYHSLKPVGRLDKDSSGILLLTNDGELANQLAHPRYQKTKVYSIELDKPLQIVDQQALDAGVQVEDYISHLQADQPSHDRSKWRITMQMGRNRQIRRTFEALGYNVIQLHRSAFGDYILEDIPTNSYKVL